jgi:hypothetical protein
MTGGGAMTISLVEISGLLTAFRRPSAKAGSFSVEPDALHLVGVCVIRLDRNLRQQRRENMAPFQTNQAAIPQEMVTKVGSAAGHVARIQQDYALQAEAETAADAREALANDARAEAERVIDEQGISIQDYNAVLAAAEEDEELERRLLDAAREVL